MIIGSVVLKSSKIFTITSATYRDNFSWKTLNVEEYGGSYRRLYMEKTFQDKIENFVPNQSDYEEVDALIELVKHDIIRAKFDQLLPPVPQVKLDISKGRVFSVIFDFSRVVLAIFNFQKCLLGYEPRIL